VGAELYPPLAVNPSLSFSAGTGWKVCSLPQDQRLGRRGKLERAALCRLGGLSVGWRKLLPTVASAFPRRANCCH